MRIITELIDKSILVSWEQLAFDKCNYLGITAKYSVKSYVSKPINLTKEFWCFNLTVQGWFVHWWYASMLISFWEHRYMSPVSMLMYIYCKPTLPSFFFFYDNPTILVWLGLGTFCLNLEKIMSYLALLPLLNCLQTIWHFQADKCWNVEILKTVVSHLAVLPVEV